MRAGLGGVGKVTGGFNHDLRAYRCPVELGRVALREDLDLLAIDGDEAFAGGNVVGQVAQDGVVLEQVRQRSRAGEIVYSHKFDVIVAQCCAKYVTANSAKAVDANLHCHVSVLLGALFLKAGLKIRGVRRLEMRRRGAAESL